VKAWIGPTFEYAYRLTLELDTRGGPASASGIYRVRQTPGPDSMSIINAGGSAPKVTGEAIFLDLGAGRNVVLLMTHGPTGANVDQIMEMPLWAFGVPAMPAARTEPVHKLVSMLAPGTKAELAIGQIPTLITFADIADPASAKVLFAGGRETIRRVSPDGRSESFHTGEPKALVDAFAETFGPGFAFRRATIEMVPKDTPVTRGIEKRLLWINNLSAYRTDPSNPFSNKLPSYISALRRDS
jgi:hypothetical protein